VVSHIAAGGAQRSLGTPVLCRGSSLCRARREPALSVETSEDERFSKIIPNELIIRPDPSSAVAQGGTQKVV